MVQRLILIACWFASMYGVLQTQNIEMGHSFCGAWGCGPPANALIGMHLFWFTFLAPPIWFAAIKTNLAWSMIGRVLIGISVLGLVVIGIYDYFFSFNQGYYDAGYVWQRYLLSVGSLVDVPVVQSLVIGMGLARFGRGCPCCSGDTAAQSKESHNDVGVDIVPLTNE